jgi:hypothetical protein
MSLLRTEEETGLDVKNARRRWAGIGRWSMLVSLLTRKIHELRIRQAFGLLIENQLPLRDSVGLSPTFPLGVEHPGSDTPET